MLKNYFKIALRNILRHEAYSILNISGLAIGMACSILILLWVQKELSYDRFNKNANQLYRLTCNAGDFKAAVSPAGMAAGLQSEMPEIAATIRLSKPASRLLGAGIRKFEEKRISSAFNIVYLLSGNFTKLIFVAVAIAIPVSGVAINSWLKGFAYHVNISWIMFLVASLAALLIAWITVSYESVKASIMNPVKSLRTE